VEGRLPEELRGTFYRMGPALHERAGERYRHWFDGDGMVQAFRFGGSGMSHKGRFVATKKRAAEEAAGHLVYPGFGTAVDGAPVRSPDDLNPANINTLPLGDELLALWEGGSAHILDPVTLETRGVKVWSKMLAGVPFSAHYKREPDGTVWNFGVAFDQKLLVLYRIAPDGALLQGDAVFLPELPFVPGMVHDFAVTERHLIFALSPFAFEREAMADGAFLDGFVWRPELGMRALVIAKDDWNDRRWYGLPAGFTFHFGNAWEETDGTIRFTHCVAEDGSVLTETFRAVMRGEWRPANAPTRYAHVTLRPGSETAEQEIGPFAAEFPRIAPAVVGARHRYEYCLAGKPGEAVWNPYGGAGLIGVARQDHETGAMTRYDYGPDVRPEEHIFVAKPGASAENDGWVIGTSLDTGAGVTRVSVFEAASLADGPVARATLPYPLPLGFHGQWRDSRV
jgi:carotenoid cleavage dioxygenase